MSDEISEASEAINAFEAATAPPMKVKIDRITRRSLSRLLQVADPAAYAEYRAIKYPTGPASKTPATQKAAVIFVLTRLRDLMM